MRRTTGDMKRLFYGLTLVLLLIGLFALPTPGLAQTGGPTPTTTPTPAAPVIAPPPTTALPDMPDPQSVVPFSMLKVVDTVMQGPYDTLQVRVGTPSTWKLTDKAEIQLLLNPHYSSGTVLNTNALALRSAALSVFVNNTLIQTISLNWSGEQLRTITIPARALQERNDGRVDLRLFLDASVDCDIDQKTTLTVSANSRFYLAHELVPPPVDLTLLPRPLYQDGSFILEPALLVVPDQPSAAELQAALTVAAGFGRMTNGQLALPLTPVSTLNTEMQKNSHIIFVGKPAGLPVLATVKLPDAAGAGEDDGVLQTAISPWNESRVLLVVSGKTDGAVIKAAQAVSSGALRTGARPDLALVVDVKESVQITTVSADRTFTDLGAQVITLSGIGVVGDEIRFFIPYGQVTNSEAYLNLVFSHSALLNYSRSNMSILLNDLLVGSARFSDTTSDVHTIRVTLPAYAVRPGVNRLAFDASLIPTDNCLDFTQNQLWVNIFPDSLLHIPLFPAQVNATTFLNLGNYPYTFNDHPTLRELAFILPQKDAIAWNIAGKLANDLGRRSYGDLIELKAVYGDTVPEDVRNQNNLIVIGKASELPILGIIAGNMPAPFAEGSNLATESSMTITYRLPPDINLGYLELFPSPWDAGRTTLGIFGSTAQGLSWAGNALTTPLLRGKLAGNFAVINDQQVLTSDSRAGFGTGNLSATAAPLQGTPQPVVLATPVPPASQSWMTARSWILPAIVVVSALIFIILLVVIIGAIRRKS